MRSLCLLEPAQLLILSCFFYVFLIVSKKKNFLFIFVIFFKVVFHSMNLTQNRIFIKTILSFIMHTGRLISTLYNHQFRYDLQNNRFHSVHVTRDVELFLKNKNKFCLGYISAKYNKTPNYSSYWSATTSWQRVLTHIEVLPGDLCLWKSVLLPSAVRVYIKKKNDLLKQLILKFQNGLKIFTGSPKSYLSYHVFRRIIRITRRMLRKC